MGEDESVVLDNESGRYIHENVTIGRRLSKSVYVVYLTAMKVG
jgi:hypothetical protein